MRRKSMVKLLSLKYRDGMRHISLEALTRKTEPRPKWRLYPI